MISARRARLKLRRRAQAAFVTALGSSVLSLGMPRLARAHAPSPSEDTRPSAAEPEPAPRLDPESEPGPEPVAVPALPFESLVEDGLFPLPTQELEEALEAGAEEIRAAGLSPREWILRIRWNDREEFSIRFSLEPVKPGAPAAHATCSLCSRDSARQAIAAVMAAAAEQAMKAHGVPRPISPQPSTPPPAPVLEAPGADAPPLRPPTVARAVGGSLIVLGATAAIAGAVVAAKGVHREEIEDDGTALYITYDVTDYRPLGYSLLGSGVAALIAGVVWIAVAESKFRKSRRTDGSRARAELRPTFAGLEVAF